MCAAAFSLMRLESPQEHQHDSNKHPPPRLRNKKHLVEKGVSTLFETPRHRPDFMSEGNTNCQIMFESPDHILFEVVYKGPKDQ